MVHFTPIYLQITVRFGKMEEGSNATVTRQMDFYPASRGCAICEVVNVIKCPAFFTADCKELAGKISSQ